jgi:hypothetical protein
MPSSIAADSSWPSSCPVALVARLARSAALVPPPADAPPTHFTLLYGYLLGLFPVNLLHSAVHLAIGVWGILAWRGVMRPRIYAPAIAIFFTALAVMGLVPGLNTLFGTLPLYGNDVWLHGGTAAVATYLIWHPEYSIEHRTRSMSDRRTETVPVAEERRHGRVGGFYDETRSAPE